jgi:hypothetical protein
VDLAKGSTVILNHDDGFLDFLCFCSHH